VIIFHQAAASIVAVLKSISFFVRAPETNAREIVSLAIKSSNLTLCFLGLADRRSLGIVFKCAQLGLASAAFDWASDRRNYEAKAVNYFCDHVQLSFGAKPSALLIDLLARKKNGLLNDCGLERGIVALEVIMLHLNNLTFANNRDKLNAVGILLQIADDLLDYEQDHALGELNFLDGPTRLTRIEEFVCWNYERDLSFAAYPSTLFAVLKQAKRVAKRFQISPSSPHVKGQESTKALSLHRATKS
jgi:hypothetical protein